MSIEALEEALRELHGHGEDQPASVPGERAALAAFAEKFSESSEAARAPASGGWRGWTRVAAAAASFAVMVGACSLPASYEVDLGVGLRLSFDPEEELPVHAMAQYAKEELGATDINVAVHVLNDDAGTLNMRLWGQSLGPDEVVTHLKADFPELESLTIETEVLEGRIDTNLGDKLFHEMFDSAIAEDDLEVARAELLAELLARGIDGDIDVEMREVEGGREIRVGVTKQIGDPDEGISGHEKVRAKVKHIEMSGGVQEGRVLKREVEIDAHSELEREP